MRGNSGRRWLVIGMGVLGTPMAVAAATRQSRCTDHWRGTSGCQWGRWAPQPPLRRAMCRRAARSIASAPRRRPHRRADGMRELHACAVQLELGGRRRCPGVSGPQGIGGPKGDPGATGAAGAPGAAWRDGTAGRSGAQGCRRPSQSGWRERTNGVHGSFRCTGSDRSQGPQGPQGPAGAKALSGYQVVSATTVVTPSIGSPHVGRVDTGVSHRQGHHRRRCRGLWTLESSYPFLGSPRTWNAQWDIPSNWAGITPARSFTYFAYAICAVTQ